MRSTIPHQIQPRAMIMMMLLLPAGAAADASSSRASTFVAVRRAAPAQQRTPPPALHHHHAAAASSSHKSRWMMTAACPPRRAQLRREYYAAPPAPPPAAAAASSKKSFATGKSRSASASSGVNPLPPLTGRTARSGPMSCSRGVPFGLAHATCRRRIGRHVTARCTSRGVSKSTTVQAAHFWQHVVLGRRYEHPRIAIDLNRVLLDRGKQIMQEKPAQMHRK